MKHPSNESNTQPTKLITARPRYIDHITTTMLVSPSTGPIKMTQSPVEKVSRMAIEMSRITFEVLKVGVEEVDIVEIGKKSSRVRRQFAEFVLTLVNILWCLISLFKKFVS